MDKEIGYFSKEQKQTLKLVGILSACLLVLLIVSIALFYSLDAPVGTPQTKYAELPVFEGMNIAEAKAALEKAQITYEIIPTESKTANRVEKIEFIGKEEGDKILIEVGTNVKLHANEVAKDKVIYLTFDDGPTRDNTDDILATLNAYGIKATFFVQGKNVDRYPEKIVATVEGGHLVGCHSHSHEIADIYTDIPSFMAEVEQYESEMKNAIGEEKFASLNKVIRFPGGTTTNSMLSRDEAKQYIAAVHEKGYVVYDWTALTGDASGNSEAKEFIDSLNSSITSAKNKDQNLIVLLHDKWSTKDALNEILEHLVAEGYYFDTIDNCPEYTFAGN